MAMRTKPYVPSFSRMAARITEPTRRRLGVGVGQPGVEREHRHLDGEAEEHAGEDPAARSSRSMLPLCAIRYSMEKPSRAARRRS